VNVHRAGALGLCLLLPLGAEATTPTVAHPYVYLGHGPVAQEKWSTVWVWFQQDVPQATLLALLEEAPFPLAVTASRDGEYFRALGPAALRVNSDDFFEDYVRIAYNPTFRKKLKVDGLRGARRHDKTQELAVKLFEDGNEDRVPTGAEWAAYHTELDRWIASVHARHPLAFALKTGRSSDDAPTAWHRWSVGQVPHVVLPRLTEAMRVARGSGVAPPAEDAFVSDVVELLANVLVWTVVQDAGPVEPSVAVAIREAVSTVEGYGSERQRTRLREIVERLRVP
jgi:hypothetical protein